jgi:hypothetical protein
MELRKRPISVFFVAGLVTLGLIGSPVARAFTQSGAATAFGNGIPMGHEWITRLAALEVIGGDPLPPDPNDPRKSWGTKGRAKNTNISSPGAQAEVARIRKLMTTENRYLSVFTPIFDAIVGERWVDIGGFNVTKSKKVSEVASKLGLKSHDCFDAVAQEPVEIQYDHFMRQYDDRDAAGGPKAARSSQQRFVDYFVAAAMAPPTTMRMWDGGGYSAQYNVDRNYFLFGRAAHLFEDSFSSEHTVRLQVDNYERVRQVKSYLCASGSEQHSHKVPTATDFSSGDVIWIEGTALTVNSGNVIVLAGWASYKASFMKPTALVATEATKDLWAAFIRTMGTPMAQREATARSEAQTLVANWLNFDENEMRSWYDNASNRDATYVLSPGQTGKGVSVAACLNTIDPKWGGDQMKAVNFLANEQRICLFNVAPLAGYSDLFDTSMHMPFNWDWTSGSWQEPPASWQIPRRPADIGTRVRIRSVANGQYVIADGGLQNGSPLRAKPGAPLDLIMVGDRNNALYRATFAPELFLSYNLTPGDGKLWNGTQDSSYRLDPAGSGFGIYNLHWKNYFWLNGDTLRLSGSGDKNKPAGQWVFEGLR